MTTTTGEPSTLKSPSSLSGGDLVSRLLAATPPYLYNVPLTPHSFFFSEMLRSFVQAKAEATPTGGPGSAARRRKRSWREARDRPLELTTKERSHHHQPPAHHHHHHHQDKYFQAQDLLPEPSVALKIPETFDLDGKALGFEQKPTFGQEVLKHADKTRYARHGKGFLEERARQLEATHSPENPFSSLEADKVKPEEAQQDRKGCELGGRSGYEATKLSSQELAAIGEQRKMEFPQNLLAGLPGRAGCEALPGAKGFGLAGSAASQDFLPGPLWYPPYPMPQSYPAIDPLHFFIDLRVSGHIWDRKLSDKQSPFKSKHCSAFSVPQSREYGNRPLNLTRDDAAGSKANEHNPRGTNHILKHLARTYRELSQPEEPPGPETSTADLDDSRKEPEGENPAEEGKGCSGSQEEERKDLRALIGLELVVDYVKEPKGDPPVERTSQLAE